MRDPNRIDDITKVINRTWKNNFPDMRFCQFMSNFERWYGSDIFFIEDDEFVKKLKDFTNYIKCS